MANIYLIEQDENSDYDTYDSCVVVANSEDEARNMNPDGPNRFGNPYSGWASSPDKVSVKMIGKAVDGLETRNGFILSSFNAG